MQSPTIRALTLVRRLSRAVGIGFITLGTLLAWGADSVSAGMTLFGLGAMLIVVALVIAAGPMPVSTRRRTHQERAPL
jgi:hypothetical protein